MNEASEALEFERAIEYRELLNSVKKVAQKQKITDSSGRGQGCTGSGVRRGRCGRTGILYPGRTSDRQGSLLSADLERRVKGQYSGQLYQTVLCRYALHPGRTDASGRCGRAGTPGDVAPQRSGDRRLRCGYRKKARRKSLWSWQRRTPGLVLTKDKERLKREEGRTIGAVKEIASLLGLDEITRMEGI